MEPLVHDVFFPSPEPLQKLAGVQLALTSWRIRINELRARNSLDQLMMEEDNFVNSLPLRGLLYEVKERVKLIGISICDWMQYHYAQIFCFDRQSGFEILNDFDDFVADADGSIDFVKTAERMLLCDRISLVEKYRIACVYCFEDAVHDLNIIGLMIDLNSLDFETHTQIYFWTCHLQHRLVLIPLLPGNDTMQRYGTIGIILSRIKNLNKNRSAAKFFWNRLTTNAPYRLEIMNDFMTNNTMAFARYILQNITLEELEEIVFEFIVILIDFKNDQLETNIFDTIMYCIHNLEDDEAVFDVYKAILYGGCSLNDGIPPDRVMMLNEIFIASPDNFKRKIIHHILSNANNNSREEIYVTRSDTSTYEYFSAKRNQKIDYYKSLKDFFEVHVTILDPECSPLFFNIIYEATHKQRFDFLCRNLPTLLACKSEYEINHLKSLCYLSERETFKLRRKWYGCNKFLKTCVSLLRNAMFANLNCLLNLLHWTRGCDTIESRKRTLLLGFHFINVRHFQGMNPYHLNMFIHTAYTDTELAMQYKVDLLKSLRVNELILSLVKNGAYLNVIHFVNAMASNGVAVWMRTRILAALERYLMSNSANSFTASNLGKFCLWCLNGDYDELAAYKELLQYDEIVRNWSQKIIRIENFGEMGEECISLEEQKFLLNEFVKWYHFQGIYELDDVDDSDDD